MTWRRKRSPVPGPDLGALEAAAAERVKAAEDQRAAVIDRARDVDTVHKQTQRLRQRNRWAALIEDAMTGRQS